MTERKFNIPLILMSVAALGLSIFAFPVEGIVLGLITIMASIKLRKKYLIKIPITLCIVSIVFSAAFLAFLIWTEFHGAHSSYWLMQLIFGAYE